MNTRDIRWLLACASLAVGEWCASLAPEFAEAWPVAAAAALLVACAGYGFGLRGWAYACLAVAGLALYLFASVDCERELRAAPWMRDSRLRRPAQHRVAESPAKRDFLRRAGLGLEPGSDAVRMNRAILLGEKRGLPRGAKRTFIESGVIHVFAISGLHVMIVARVLMFFAALAFVPYRLQGAVSAPFVWGYVALVGFTPSAVRAALMATLCFSAPLFWRRPDALSAWAVAFLAVHVVNPHQIGDVASQLSFTVMLALVVADRVSRDVGAGLVRAVYFTLVAWAAGVPIAAATFGRVTPGGVVANLLLVAAAGYSVAAGAVGVVASFVWEPLAAHLNNLSAVVSGAMVAVSGVVSRMPWSNIEVEPWGAAECAGWYVALGLALYLVHRARARRDLV